MLKLQPALDREGRLRLLQLRRLLDMRLELSGIAPGPSSPCQWHPSSVCVTCGICATCATSAPQLLAESTEARERVGSLLQRLDLTHYAAAIVQAGFVSTVDLYDADEDELTELALTLQMKRPELRRLLKGVASHRQHAVAGVPNSMGERLEPSGSLQPQGCVQPERQPPVRELEQGQGQGQGQEQGEGQAQAQKQEQEQELGQESELEWYSEPDPESVAEPDKATDAAPVRSATEQFEDDDRSAPDDRAQELQPESEPDA